MFGVGAITRDTVQNLDFLDLTITVNKSFNSVSGELGSGGLYEGFRYATVAEVIALVNNYGFSPTLTFVPNQPVNGDTGGSQLWELVELLGIVQNNPTSYGLSLTGLVEEISKPNFRTTVSLYARPFPNNPSLPFADDQVIFSEWPQATNTSIVGSFLVRASPASPDPAAEVPEPASLALWSLMSVAGVAAWRRRTLA